MKKIVLLLSASLIVVAGEETPEPTPRMIPITKETMSLYCADMQPFIDTKRNEKEQLARLPDSKSFFGKAANFFIENVFAPLFSTYGNVNIEEAKVFLGRSFEREDLLQKAIAKIPNNPATLVYLDAIFSQAEGDILTKKDGPRFLEIVKKVKYSNMRDPKCMGDKDQHGNYVLCNTDFYNFSAATFMAFHIFENHVTIAPSLRRQRKLHMQEKT